MVHALSATGQRRLLTDLPTHAVGLAVQGEMRFTVAIPLVFVLAACGDDGGGGSADAPPNVPAMITVSGTATERGATGSTPLNGATIAAYRNSDPNTAVVSAMTDASGMYTLTISTNGVALDGYLKATYNGVLDTYLYPPRPLVADFAGASVFMVSANTLDLLSNLLCRNQQDLAKGVIAVLVSDAADMPVAGAMVSSMPAAAKYCYNSGGNPSQNATMTDTDGIGYMLNVTAGEVTVSASKSGSTFSSHKVNARANSLTTTIIQ